MIRRFAAGLALTPVLASVLAACAPPPALDSGDIADGGRVDVIATTPILADIARNVGGDRANVVSLVPDQGDPHTYEPSLRDIRNVVYADLALSNYLLLEEHSLIKALDANLQDGVPNVSLAEEAVKYAAHIIPLVEDVSLDTVWLGLRVRGDGARVGADRSSETLLSATSMDGPGDLVAYLTGSFGDTDAYVDSRDGFDADSGYRDDTAVLPADAHTHMSWAFTEPGVYRLSLSGAVKVTEDAKPIPVGSDTFTFAVGVDPHRAGIDDPVVVDGGHADLTVDIDTGELLVLSDPSGGGEATQREYAADRVVIDVPSKSLTDVPGDPGYRFLGDPGDRVYQLPQAVLGKHIHGEIDPHLWQDVRNAQAYAKVIRDQLIAVDPDGAVTYTRNTRRYVAELDALDQQLTRDIGRIPPERRHLITTHDAFAYLADAYGLKVSGFVTPNPAAEPSLADRRRLTETIRNLHVPAVFLEPNLASRSSTLTQVAREEGVEVCAIYGDAFDREVSTYIQMMRANARSLVRCLS